MRLPALSRITVLDGTWPRPATGRLLNVFDASRVATAATPTTGSAAAAVSRPAPTARAASTPMDFGSAWRRDGSTGNRLVCPADHSWEDNETEKIRHLVLVGFRAVAVGCRMTTHRIRV